MSKFRKIAVILAIFIGVSTSYAGSGTGSSAVNFLNIGISARSSATGGAFSAVSDGPVSAYYNPAGLARAENMQLAGMHAEWLQDLRYEYLGFASPIGSNGGLGISFSYLSYGNIDGYTDTNTPTGSVSAFDLSAGISYAHRIRPNILAGAGIKYVGEKLDNVQASGVAGDLGMQYDGGRFLIGLSVMNIGPSIKFDQESSPLPTTVNAGFLFHPLNDAVTVMTGMSTPLSGGISLRGGVEYSYRNLLILRTGYNSRDEMDSKSGLSFGGGLNFSLHSLDYAYNVNTMFGGTHQISFVFRFGGQRSEPAVHYEEYTAPQDDAEVKPVERKPAERKSKYHVCAGKYSDKESAVKHIKTLKLMDVSAKLVKFSENEFRVVLKEVEGMSKAQKVKEKFEKRGISCLILEA